MYKALSYLFLLVTAIFVNSCDLINTKEEIPIYIDIQNVSVNAPFYDVPDVWVYVNDNFVGAYSLPAHFPVLVSGTVKVTVKAGIKKNGISLTRAAYPFFTNYTKEINVVPGQTYSLSPVFSYLDNLVFDINEDFESVAINFEPSDSTGYKIYSCDTVYDSPSNNVGQIILKDSSTFKIQSIEDFFLPGNRPVYLEFSYKTNGNIEFAWTASNIVTGTITQSRLYQTLPTNGEWKHVYLYLATYLGDFNLSINRFRFLIGSSNNTGADVEYYLDNIKLIYAN